MIVRGVWLGAWLAVSILAGGCAGSGRQAAATPAQGPPLGKRVEPKEMPVPSGCSVVDHKPFPADDAQAKPDSAPEPITRVPPEYPDEARTYNITGVVRHRVLVCEHGRVVKAMVVNSVPRLDQAAADALVQWTFKPAQRGGRPVAAWVEMPIRFSIDGR